MSYCFTKVVDTPLDATIARVTEELRKEGFGILTQIDVRATLADKLGVAMRDYRILGACNPEFAHRALELEERIGTMLPCNVIVRERADGTIEVAAVDPVASMAAVQNDRLGEVAEQVRSRLAAVIERL